jgi:1-acyl-sn-glycerol-3-phosphate acyltransferase
MIFYRIVVTLSRPLIWFAFRPEVEGREHLPAKGGYVLAANHLSGFDVFAVSYALAPRAARNMAKNELFERRFVGPLVRGLGAFPAHGEERTAGGRDTAVALARAGGAVVIFPEGARRRPDREHRPRTGAARAALDAGVPLVPAALRGTDGWRQLRRWRIAVGPPVAVDDLRAGDALGSAREGTTRLWMAINELESKLDRGP